MMKKIIDAKDILNESVLIKNDNSLVWALEANNKFSTRSALKLIKVGSLQTLGES